VCFDMLRSSQRRARAIDIGPASRLGADLGAPLPESSWVQPVPDGLVLPEAGDPAELATARETIRLAFVAALQHLAPRQRAVLILRDVLCWKAEEVARLLDATVASVNSALQRARSTLQARRPSPGDRYERMDKTQQDLLAGYVDAFERHDVEALVRMLHEDATMTMPPYRWWLRGRTEIRLTLLGTDACANDRLLPTVANGSPAFGQYHPDPDGHYQPFALVVLEISDGLITDTTSYLDPERLFTWFDLPAELPAER
jgi:RNA polymerase sigma-70 factor (ECF subfamily)